MIQKKMITGLRLPPSLIRRLLVRLHEVPAVKPESKAETELLNDILEGLSALSDGRCDALMLERDQKLSASEVRQQKEPSLHQNVKQPDHGAQEHLQMIQAEGKMPGSEGEMDGRETHSLLPETAIAAGTEMHSEYTGRRAADGAEEIGQRRAVWTDPAARAGMGGRSSSGVEAADEGAVITGTLSIYPRARLVYQGSEPVSLTAKEFDILYFLARNRGEVFTKEQIYQAVWDGGYLLDDSNIMAFVRKIRRKIEPNPDAPIYIQTVWGIGYKFAEQSQTKA